MKATGASVLAVGGLGAVGSAAAQAADLPPLARDGNKIVDPSGNEVFLRGVNIADPNEQARSWRGQTAPETFDLATNENEGWYTNIVRVPMHPSFIASGTRAPSENDMPHGDDWGPALPGQFDASDVEWYCNEFIDDLVDMGAEKGAYVMLDYHRHYPVFHQPDHADHGVDPNVWVCSSDGGEDWRNPEVCGERGVLWHGEDQTDEILDLVEEQNIVENAEDLDSIDDVYLEPAEVSNALDEEIHTFWEVVADRYAEEDHVVFDVYNEPTGPYGGDWGGPQRQAGELSQAAAEDYHVDQPEMKEWYDLWRDRAQPWVDTVEDNAPGHLLTIGNPRWSQYTYWSPVNEFDAENMAYTSHVYTQDDLRPLSRYVGQPSQEVPVIFSEFGWMEGGGELVETPWMDCSGDAFDEEGCQPYIDEYTEFVEEYPVHPIVWNFDHTYEPNMFEHGTPGENDGAKGADDWMEYLNDETPGVWWHELNQDYRMDSYEPASGDEPYPDADNDPTGWHGADPVDWVEYDEEPGTGEPEPGEGEIQVGDYNTQDTTDDGLHNDFDGDGETTHDDVTAFFENLENDTLRNNGDSFDFDDNGRIGFGDVIDLLRRV